MAVWEQYANHERLPVIPKSGLVLDFDELRSFVAKASAAELKEMIDSGSLTAKEVGAAQAANKAAARAKANPR